MVNLDGQFVIYGAGNRGKWCLDFLKWRKIDDRIWGFCDKRHEELRLLGGKRVVSYHEAKTLGIPFLISCSDEEVANDILQKIKGDGIEAYLYTEFYKLLREDESVFLREECAYYHAKHNDKWFNDAERKEAVDVFWKDGSPFYRYFKELDLDRVIELACGRGRHVPFYMGQAGEITLVDILEENIAICQERFRGCEKIVYYKNNGYNFEELIADSYSSVFSYDSMVHFELMDVYTYLKDMYRVLRKGGKALLHHSNYTTDYAADFLHAPHSRCFMSKDIFAYLAHRAGFQILSQEVIDWYDSKDLDCITLLRK